MPTPIPETSFRPISRFFKRLNIESVIAVRSLWGVLNKVVGNDILFRIANLLPRIATLVLVPPISIPT